MIIAVNFQFKQLERRSLKKKKKTAVQNELFHLFHINNFITEVIIAWVILKLHALDSE